MGRNRSPTDAQMARAVRSLTIWRADRAGFEASNEFGPRQLDARPARGHRARSIWETILSNLALLASASTSVRNSPTVRQSLKPLWASSANVSARRRTTRYVTDAMSND